MRATLGATRSRSTKPLYWAPRLGSTSESGMALAENRAFRLFWIGQTTSNLGDAFAFVALPLLVFEATKSVVAMGTVTAISAGGQFASTTFSGQVVDRASRRRLMIACDLVRLVLFATLPVGVKLGVATLPVICALMAIVSVASNLFFVAYMSAIPNLVAAEDVPAANGRLRATHRVHVRHRRRDCGCRMQPFRSRLGARRRRALVRRLGVLSHADRVSRGRRREGEGGMLGGLRFLLGHSTLRALSIFQTAVALLGSIGVGAAVIDLMVYRMKTDFRASGARVGVVLALAAIGSVIGALTAARLRKRISFGAIVVIGTTLQGFGMLGAGLASHLALVAVGAALWSTGLAFRAVGAMSLRQLETPDALIGRVSAAGWFMVYAGATLGAFLTTRIAGSIGVAPTTTGIGLLLLAICALGMRSQLVSGR